MGHRVLLCYSLEGERRYRLRYIQWFKLDTPIAWQFIDSAISGKAPCTVQRAQHAALLLLLWARVIIEAVTEE